MVIKGQKFYDMLDSDKQVKFGVHQVQMVTMETVDIEYLSEDLEPMGEETVHIVCVLLDNGKFVATRPNKDQDFVATIAHTLVDMANKFASAHLN